MRLRNKHILLGITGSIAAYKAAYLVRLLVKEGARVQVIMSEQAGDFITPLTLSTLSRNPVLQRSFSPADGTWINHVQLGLEADLFIIAPATANTLAKMAQGIADNLLLTTYLSARCPVVAAPAMDLDMYRHPATRRNLETLVNRGNFIIDAETGDLASGLQGEGRMSEPENILAWVHDFFRKKNKIDLNGKKVLITAGPTREALDPVRYMSNHSSGKMGYALAEKAADAGAEVVLVSGPTSQQINHRQVQVIPVDSARDMLKACMRHFPGADIIIMAAAVADYAPAETHKEKMKKKGKEITLRLVENPDILSLMGKKKKKGQLLVGFALETDDGEVNARKKLREKNADFIVLNSLKDKHSGFGADTNKITILGASKKKRSFPVKPKTEVALDILFHILQPSYDKVS